METGIPILPNPCLILPNEVFAVGPEPPFVVILSTGGCDSYRAKHRQSHHRSAEPGA